MPTRPAHSGARPAAPDALPPATTDERVARQSRTALAALRSGTTAMATIGGLALYLWLTQRHVAALIAIPAGLLFAICGRFAALSLGREWLLRAAALHRAAHDAAPRADGPGDAPPGSRSSASTTDAPSPRRRA